MRSRILAILCTSIIAAAGMLSLSDPAQAFSVVQGLDYTSHSYDGKSFTVCDGEDDGHSVWAGLYDSGSTSYQTAPVLYPPDPAGLNCTDYDVFPPYYLTNLRTVEDNPNSSTNYYSEWHGYPVVGN